VKCERHGARWGERRIEAEETSVGLLVALTAALGVLLIYLSASRRPDEDGAGAPPAARARLEVFLRGAGAEGMRSRDFVLSSLVVGMAVGGAAWLVLGWPCVAAVAGLVGTALPAWYLRHRRDVRRAELQQALAEAVDALRSSVRVGMSIEEALAALAHQGPAPLRPALRELARDLRLAGFEAAITRTREHLADPVFDTVAAALLMAHRVGGRNLGPVLDSLERAVRGAARVEREVRAQQARNVLSARIIAALPLGLVVAIRGLNPTYLDPFTEPAGQLLLAGCLLSVAAGYALMLRAARLPALPRSRR
jgi:tight adherence protein B